jgi:dihydrofolate synthase/folylpolyglutamate synthase
MKTEYQQALDYLDSFTDYSKLSGFLYSPERFDLKRVERLLALIGAQTGGTAPHLDLKTVHVAGTKGKGSTSAMIASILRESGYRTGLYTSPHLHTFRERIQIDGQLISQQQLVAGVNVLRAVAPQVPEITTFELVTALAFYHFQHKCDLAVIEVGMGGRLDATNVIEPSVSVITSISYDHMMYLGDTLAAIAAEKAGIIKPGVPVVSAPQPPEAQEVIERAAAERGCPFILVGRDWTWENVSSSAEGQQFAVQRSSASPAPSDGAVYRLSLLGRHQQENATTALATVALLQSMGLHIPDRALHAGLQNAQWPGRLEVLHRHPWVIVDGAHNGYSMQKLRAAIDAQSDGALFPHNQMILILGASADKDIDAMFDAILPACQHVLLTQSQHPRAATAESLAERIAASEDWGAAPGDRERTRPTKIPVHVVPIDRALEAALDIAGNDDLICITGSLFVVADLRAAWFERTGQPVPSDADTGHP